LTSISGAPRYRSAKYRLAKFLAIDRRLQHPTKKSPHHRLAFKLCNGVHFNICEQPAYESTTLNKNNEAKPEVNAM
jgi:hypothetical protein